MLEHVFDELELPLQYGDSVQHVDDVLQVLPLQLVTAPHRPVPVLHIVPSGQMPEYVPQWGWQMPALHTLPVPHGLLLEHVRAHTLLPPTVVQVAPAPHSVELLQARVHMPAVFPASFIQTTVRSPAQSPADVHGLPISELPAGVSSGGSVESEVLPSVCGHGPASPPQGVGKPALVLDEHAAVMRAARPNASEARRVVDMCGAPLNGAWTDDPPKRGKVVRLYRTFRTLAERGCTRFRRVDKRNAIFGLFLW